MQGLITAVATPFDKEGKLNGKMLRDIMDWNVRMGADGFFVAGSSGECFLLSEEERMQLFEEAAPFAGKTQLIAHVGALDTAQAQRYARRAMALGYDMVAATPPFYYPFSPAETARYFEEIAEASGKPVLYYNFPASTGKQLDLGHEAYRRLLCSGTIGAVKQTYLDLKQMERIHHLNPSLKIFGGYDEVMVAALAIGEDGSIGSSFNFMAGHFRKIFDLAKAGKAEEALRLQEKANNIMDALTNAGLVPAIKYALSLLGYDAGAPRRPFLPLGEDAQASVRAAIEADLENE
ncbi:MAG: dihydrodipicolinate synthase family protein [Provencibacterium sp.]|jgi:N-acetylneuraminate lyase|nr:dihydrodipicolinate synthase family protein [Provencibacterium sp.]